MKLSLPVIEKPNGVVLFEGKSQLNGKEIVVIATGLNNPSENEKTGEMIQTWILLKDIHPMMANKQGDDDSICGDCKHRHFRSCYVNLANAPTQVYKTYKNNRYPKIALDDMPELFKNRNIRLGSYGDPTAIPIIIWDMMLSKAKGWTAYTHQFKKPKFAAYKKYCMASCDTLEEVKKATKLGWRPFYARQESEPLQKGFFSCPASKEQNHRLNCSQCKVCKGGEYREGQGIVSIVVHGPSWKKTFFNRGMKLIKQKKKYIGVNLKSN